MFVVNAFAYSGVLRKNVICDTMLDKTTKYNLEGQSEKSSHKGINQQDNICWRPE